MSEAPQQPESPPNGAPNRLDRLAAVGDVIDDRYELLIAVRSTHERATWTARDRRLGRSVTVDLHASDDQPGGGGLAQLLAAGHVEGRRIFDAGHCFTPSGFCTFVVSPLVAATPSASSPVITKDGVDQDPKPQHVMAQDPLSAWAWDTPVTIHRAGRRVPPRHRRGVASVAPRHASAEG